MTDFPRAEASDPGAAPGGSDADWGAVGFAGAAGAALGALLVTSWPAVRRRARPAPC